MFGLPIQWIFFFFSFSKTIYFCDKHLISFEDNTVSQIFIFRTALIIMPLCGPILQVRTFKISDRLKFQDRAECGKSVGPMSKTKWAIKKNNNLKKKYLYLLPWSESLFDGCSLAPVTMWPQTEPFRPRWFIMCTVLQQKSSIQHS